jgi:hypothetical protein
MVITPFCAPSVTSHRFSTLSPTIVVVRLSPVEWSDLMDELAVLRAHRPTVRDQFFEHGWSHHAREMPCLPESLFPPW